MTAPLSARDEATARAMSHRAPALLAALPSPLHAALLAGGAGVLVGALKGEGIVSRAVGYAALAGLAVVAIDVAFGAGAAVGFVEGRS